MYPGPSYIPTEQQLQRLMSHVSPEPMSGCWLWTGWCYGSIGYGKIPLGGKPRLVHRILYEYHFGSIPAGMQLDHLCRVRCCVNPAHLEVVTPRQNSLRGVSFSAVNHKKTHCLRGHALDGDNVRPHPKGGRICRACAKILHLKWEAKPGSKERHLEHARKHSRKLREALVAKAAVA